MSTTNTSSSKKKHANRGTMTLSTQPTAASRSQTNATHRAASKKKDNEVIKEMNPNTGTRKTTTSNVAASSSSSTSTSSIPAHITVRRYDNMVQQEDDLNNEFAGDNNDLLQSPITVDTFAASDDNYDGSENEQDENAIQGTTDTEEEIAKLNEKRMVEMKIAAIKEEAAKEAESLKEKVKLLEQINELNRQLLQQQQTITKKADEDISRPNTLVFRDGEIKEVKFATLKTDDTLENFIYEVERAARARQFTSTDTDKWILTIRAKWDRQMDIWWQSTEKARVEPKWKDWNEIKGVLIKHFIPIGAGDKVAQTFYTTKQGEREPLTEFVSRMQTLILQMKNTGWLVSNNKDIDENLSQQIFLKMCRETYPQTKMRVQQWVHDKKKAGKSHGYQELLDYILVESTLEAGKNVEKQDLQNKKERKISSIQRKKDLYERKAESKKLDADQHAEYRVCAMRNIPYTGKCRKCGEEGHSVIACTSNKEIRDCWKCKKVGHLSKNCYSKGTPYNKPKPSN